MNKPTLLSLTAALALTFGAAAMAQTSTNNGATRALDRAAGTAVSRTIHHVKRKAAAVTH